MVGVLDVDVEEGWEWLTLAGRDDHHKRVADADFGGAFPTIGAAARKLGITQGTLSSEIDRLERELGGELIIHAERGRRTTLTRLGIKFVRAVETAAP